MISPTLCTLHTGNLHMRRGDRLYVEYPSQNQQQLNSSLGFPSAFRKGTQGEEEMILPYHTAHLRPRRLNIKQTSPGGFEIIMVVRGDF